MTDRLVRIERTPRKSGTVTSAAKETVQTARKRLLCRSGHELLGTGEVLSCARVGALIVFPEAISSNSSSVVARIAAASGETCMLELKQHSSNNMQDIAK